MATWQFDAHLIPESGLLRRFGHVPDLLPLDGVDPDLWPMTVSLEDLAPALDRMLPRLMLWHGDIRSWGEEDSDRIDVVEEEGRVVDVFIRIDVRKDILPFVQALVDFSKANGSLTRMESGSLIRPSIGGVFHAIRLSSAFRFVLDPAAFLRQIGAGD